VRVYAVLVLSVLAASSPARAGYDEPPRDEQAREHLVRGNRALDLAHYDEAIVEYEQGARIERRAIWWANIAIAHRRAGRLKEAVRAYRTFLEQLGNDPTAEDARAKVHAQIDELEARIAATPDPQREPPAPVVQSVVTKVDVKQAPVVVMSGAGDRVMPARRRVAIALGGAGAALGIAGGVLGISAAERLDEANGEPNRAKQRSLRDSADTREAWGVGLAVAGGAAVVGAAVLWFWPSAEAGPLSIAAGPGDAGVAAAVRF
jgi:tetratricopeptide (TPR) repeat protein